MKTIPLEIQFVAGGETRRVTVPLTFSEIRRLQGHAMAAGVTAREWVTAKISPALENSRATLAPAPPLSPPFAASGPLPPFPYFPGNPCAAPVPFPADH